ncbi:MAG: DUF3857 domain-containing protein, partial [Candidatus Symbiothrix sp.]|nr:DUF3857 domain-containing protein [Candidatus Symbiothrix sp.]
MRRILLSIIFLSICGFLQAADDYEKMAQAVREEVWNWDLPAFNNRVIPAEYDTCSAVILARHEQIFVGTKKKIRYDPMTILARNAELTYTNTDRMMIKINDKRALDNYSEIEFQQMKKSYGYRIQNTFTSIIGARIIKPDGNIIEIDASQSIALLDEKSDKQRKLTIPNLQVGDILDYFYYDEYKMDNQDIHSLIFHLASSTPMLSYSIHCEAEKGIRLEYRPYNNAPDFTSSNAPETNNLILDLQTADIQTYRSEIWTNAIRNFPLIRMNIIHIDNKNIARPKREDNQSMLIKNPSYQQVIEDTKWSASLESRGFYYDRKGSLFFEKKIKNLKDKYVSNHPNASLDEISAFIFYAQRFYAFNTITEESKILVDADRNFRKA